MTRQVMKTDPAQVPAELATPATDAGQPPPRCGYCHGIRCPCHCTADCGARPGDGQGHVCGHAPPDVIRAWLVSTGLYPELEAGT